MKRQRAFRFGVIDESSLSHEEWVQKAQRVEQLGYSTFLIRDHFIQGDFNHQLAPIPALMAAADATKTLRVGSLVFSNDYRHPIMLAKEAATVDLLSGGRFELGIGAGWLRSEYEQTGIPLTLLEYVSNVCKRPFIYSKEPLLSNHSLSLASITQSLTSRVFPNPYKNRIPLCLLAQVANACSPLQPAKPISSVSSQKL